MSQEPSVRVIVTGVNEHGKSVIVSDDRRPLDFALAAYPGYGISRLWPPEDPDAGRGSARFIAFQIPPDSGIVSRLEELRGRGSTRPFAFDDEPSFGMHQNSSTDFIIVLAGKVSLRVDDGVEAHLEPGDLVIQGGARHAWRNHGDVPCLMAGALVRSAGT